LSDQYTFISSLVFTSRVMAFHFNLCFGSVQCRLCGHLFCSSCTAKFHLPQEFKLKNKPGPDRVCYTCRDQCVERRQTFMAARGTPSEDPSTFLGHFLLNSLR
jgi:hypothetical protein